VRPSARTQALIGGRWAISLKGLALVLVVWLGTAVATSGTGSDTLRITRMGGIGWARRFSTLASETDAITASTMRWMRPFRCSRRVGFHGKSILINVPSRWRLSPSDAASVPSNKVSVPARTRSFSTLRSQR
jgi:hypothetical protein